MSLALLEVPKLTLGPYFVAPSITKLTIDVVKAGSFNLLVKMFPNAEEVHLEGVKVEPGTSDVVNWPKLRSLTVWSSPTIPWMSLRAPRIASFS